MEVHPHPGTRKVVSYTLSDPIAGKIARIQEGGAPRLLDLFSGCGGLSLGFHRAGYEIVGAIELDKDAADTHALNFHNQDDGPDCRHSKPRDIRRTDPSAFFQDLGLEGKVEDQIDVIVGGPPCQAFTRIGRAKLREVSSDQNAFLNDPRSKLYKRYLYYVRRVKPLAILMENVPDVLNYGGVNIVDLVCKDLTEQGYNCRYTLLNSVYYGVPQMRERMFLVAIHNEIKCEISFPEPTNFIELPVGYHGSRNVALKHINQESNPYFVPSPSVSKALTPALSVYDALSDLPIIDQHLRGKLKRGTRNMDVVQPYSKALPSNGYQMLMRNWISDHPTGPTSNAIRYLPRDYPIFRQMKPGDQYPDALKVAHRLLRRKVQRVQKATGAELKTRSARYRQLVEETVPPYDEAKFPNKWRKMEMNAPARTLMAHLGKDSYSHIHYDSQQARTISVREAARLQTFPDGFRFSGSMNSVFRQIGNAVPPMLALNLANTILNFLARRTGQ